MAFERTPTAPVNKIISKGTCVEFTRKPSEAKDSYRTAAAPKEWWVVNEDGTARLEAKV